MRKNNIAPSMKFKDKLYLSFLFLGLLAILSGLIYSSCNDPVYAESNKKIAIYTYSLDSAKTDSICTINISKMRRQLLSQLEKLKNDETKIIGILEYLDWLEKNNEKK